MINRLAYLSALGLSLYIAAVKLDSICIYAY